MYFTFNKCILIKFEKIIHKRLITLVIHQKGQNLTVASVTMKCDHSSATIKSYGSVEIWASRCFQKRRRRRRRIWCSQCAKAQATGSLGLGNIWVSYDPQKLASYDPQNLAAQARVKRYSWADCETRQVSNGSELIKASLELLGGIYSVAYSING